mmetsp:Transcript_19802/g.27838  ORF Transcript_19802/g.27838 Transcript_19802/m.27838 type:complete len:494 (+) Transcript_19802:1039-2520(+)
MTPSSSQEGEDERNREEEKGYREIYMNDPDIGSALDPHPDPNEENYEGMVYVGRLDDNGKRVGFERDNGIRYIFGTGFDESHKEIEEEDLHHKHYGPDASHDMASRGHNNKSREQVLREQRHGDPNKIAEGPKPFGHHETHPLDGGRNPPLVVHVDPFFMDIAPVTNREFGKFVRSTYYKTEAEQFGWSFVLSSFLPDRSMLEKGNIDVDPDATHWAAIDGAYWRHPEGPNTSYKYRENHPVVHVSHRDAAEYCTWKGKRLPGEWEWEAAARASRIGPTNRTLYAWGDDATMDVAKLHANLWGEGAFPDTNHAEDGWRGTSPVKHYPPNDYGFYDMTGNVWEWMRGGKHKARIVRGGSYVDSLDGSFNHAATLGARATLHGTTSTGNVGFRCVKAPKRRTEYHYATHDERTHGTLAIEDKFGKQHAVPQRDWEDRFVVHEDDDDDGDDDGDGDDDEFESWEKETEETEDKVKSKSNIKKKKVVLPRTRYSDEL